MTLSVEERFEQDMMAMGQEERLLFKQIDRNAAPHVQDRILLYPLGSQEVSNQLSAQLSLRALETRMSEGISFLSLTGSGIRKNIPQLSVSSSFTLTGDKNNIL